MEISKEAAKISKQLQGHKLAVAIQWRIKPHLFCILNWKLSTPKLEVDLHSWGVGSEKKNKRENKQRGKTKASLGCSPEVPGKNFAERKSKDTANTLTGRALQLTLAISHSHFEGKVFLGVFLACSRCCWLHADNNNSSETRKTGPHTGFTFTKKERLSRKMCSFLFFPYFFRQIVKRFGKMFTLLLMGLLLLPTGLKWGSGGRCLGIRGDPGSLAVSSCLSLGEEAS